MIEIYCRLIINKRRTYDRVPNDFKEAVSLRLAELGYDNNGDRLISEE